MSLIFALWCLWYLLALLKTQGPSHLFIPNWILSRCSTANEAKRKLDRMRLWGTANDFWPNLIAGHHEVRLPSSHPSTSHMNCKITSCHAKEKHSLCLYEENWIQAIDWCRISRVTRALSSRHTFLRRTDSLSRRREHLYRSMMRRWMWMQQARLTP